ncbi:MAG: prolyl oligopeptidase family serine peptidase [Verrucomicrobiales bacterium]|nr:prolyl oligopeptidase family serine peptidase [Verrucomicrobiales bacterium]
MKSTPAVDPESVKGYPDGVKVVTYQSSGDQSEQPALFWKPESDKPVPLLVGLHTWSSHYKQDGGEAVYAKWCQKVGWAFIHPNFRGPNRTPEAMGADLAVADIVSAVDFAKANAKIDADRIYAIGVSGGGHASLLMAGRAPEIWAGVSAWCGISDIAAWHAECDGNEKFSRYAKDIENALGGRPESGTDRAKSATRRSPVTWLSAAKNVPLDINHGVHDGRTGSVPFTHSLHAWNAVVDESNQVADSVIAKFYKTQSPPEPANPDSFYGEKRQPVFRKTAGNTRLTIFEGGHEIIHEPALNWLAAQRKGRPAVWEVEKFADLETGEAEKESGK